MVAQWLRHRSSEHSVLGLVYGRGGHSSFDEGRKQECLVCQILDVLQTGFEINLYLQHELHTRIQSILDMLNYEGIEK